MNDSWLSLWPNTTVTNGTTLGFDHCPVLVQCEQKIARRKKLFRFEAFWAKDGECKEIVRGVWENNREGNPVERWNIKIHVCRANLTRWSSVKFKQ